MAKLNTVLAGMTLVLVAVVARGQTGTVSPAATGSNSPAPFRLGADDVIQIHAVEAEEISDKPIRIAVDGYINLPTVGRVKAGGLTPEQLQADLAQRLKRIIVEPDVSVSVVETRSQPVSVVGAVKTPGVIQLNGRKTLVEIITLAGGPRDDAGYTARIMRQREFGPLPLPRSTTDPTGQFSVAEVNLQNVMQARDPAANLVVMPNDVISVPKADMVYVIGDVLHAGGIAMSDQKTVTVLQALSIAAGLGKTAKATDAKILRLTPGSHQRTEVTVNLKAILAGKLSDVPMQAEDILYVPTSLRKDIGFKAIDALGGSGVTSVIYRIP